MKNASRTLLDNFREAGGFTHALTKGEAREGILRDFLSERIPARFGIGFGQVIGPDSPDSRQSDVILYDTNICAPIRTGKTQPQIYPIEGVSGIIEVKSALSKSDLYDGLKKIADFKLLVPKNNVQFRNGPMHYIGPREHPFGIIFAFALSDNSIESLLENLIAYDKTLGDPGLTANAVVVLGEGMIVHKNRLTLRDVVLTDELRQQPFAAFPGKYGDSTLFECYTLLLHLLVNTQLAVVDLNKYRLPVERVGNHIARKHNRMSRRGDARRYRLTADFIDRVFQWCQGHEKLSSNELNSKILPPGTFSQLPATTDGPKTIYFYNPENLQPPSDEQIYAVKDGIVPGISTVGTFWIEIDGEEFAIPQYYTEGNTELAPGLDWNDP